VKVYVNLANVVMPAVLVVAQCCMNFT